VPQQVKAEPLSLLDYVKVFNSDDSFELDLYFKLKKLKPQIQALEKEITDYLSDFSSMIVEQGLIDDTEFYMDLAREVGNKTRNDKLKRLQKEFGQVQFAYRLTRRLNRGEKVELKHDPELALRQAKQYPLENLYQGKLVKKGDKFIGKCPFHDDDTPSFFIYPDNRFYCFGCKATGDSVDFYSKINNCSLGQAIKALSA